MCDLNLKVLFYVTFETADSKLDDISQLQGDIRDIYLCV